MMLNLPHNAAPVNRIPPWVVACDTLAITVGAHKCDIHYLCGHLLKIII